MMLPCIAASAHLQTTYTILQADITAIVTRVEEKKHLKLHVDKCNLMLISRKRTCSIPTPPLFAKVGSPLKQVESVSIWVRCSTDIRPVME